MLADLDTLVPLAPLHQPHNLRRHSRGCPQPRLPQVACFDTSFHRGQPDVAARSRLPRRSTDEGVHRYGFHGLSYEYIARTLPSVAPALAGGRVVVAHLGNGASMCAMKAGRSFDSTMGFTALEGLPMGTRCGALDPGIVLYLLREKQMTQDDIERLLLRDCGFRGLSGLTTMSAIC